MGKSKLENIVDLSAIINANDYEQELLYYPRSMAMLSILPLKKSKDLYYSRVNGNYTFSITGNPKYGLAYGVYPRLLWIYLFNYVQIHKTKKIILGNSLYGFLKSLNITASGSSYKRIREQLLALVNSVINIGFDSDSKSNNKNILISPENQLHWIKHTENSIDIFESYIVISDQLYDEFLSLPIPALTPVIKNIKNSAFQLDLYLFLNYRVFALNKQNKYKKVFITNEQLQNQFASKSKSIGEFKRVLNKNLNVIKAFWQDLNVQTNRHGMVIYKSENMVKDSNNQT